MGGRQFQPLAAAGSRQHGIPEAFEERALAFQHIPVIVDAKNYSGWEFRTNRLGHCCTFTESIFRNRDRES
jgi:hypothetical protein